MNAPLNKYKFKGIELAYWGGGSFSIRKSYKPKNSDQWVEHKIPKMFREELIELEKLIHEALCQPIEQESTQGKSLMDSLPPVASKRGPPPWTPATKEEIEAINRGDFDDQDIPF